MITSGDIRSPVILHVPHSSTVIPDDVRAGTVLDDQELAAELLAMTDAYTDRIALQAAERSEIRPWIFTNPFSRLVVDPERFPDPSEEMERVGMGAVYTRTSEGRPLRPDPPADRHQLMDRYYHPYAAAMTDLVADRVAACGAAVIVDVHSYPSRALPYELHGDQRRPALCIGSDPFHTDDALVHAAAEAWKPLGETIVNEPFAGAYVPLDRYGTDNRVRAIMLELRRDTYLDETDRTRPPDLALVVDALTHFLTAIA